MIISHFFTAEEKEITVPLLLISTRFHCWGLFSCIRFSLDLIGGAALDTCSLYSNNHLSIVQVQCWEHVLDIMGATDYFCPLKHRLCWDDHMLFAITTVRFSGRLSLSLWTDITAGHLFLYMLWASVSTYICTSLPPWVFLSMSLRAPSVAVGWFFLMPGFSSPSAFSMYFDREQTTASTLELFKAVNWVFVKGPWPHPLMINETWYSQVVSLPS